LASCTTWRGSTGTRWRIYGAGIVSSRAESVYSLEDRRPRRISFDLERVMRTPYKIDDLQRLYVVIPSLKTLLDATLQDFGPIYARLKDLPDLPDLTLER
jgi:phenylalanine-4-hydroxylase